MPGGGENALDRPLLDDLALLHHADGIGELAHDAEVVRDEQHRHAEPRLQLLEQFENLRLHRDVERGGRLVGDQQVGLVGERHRDHHALALAAGKLVRIALQSRLRLGNADLGQEFERARPRRGPGQALMQQQDFADLLLDHVQRIERGHRLLEDDGDVVAAHVAHLAFRQRQQVAALELDRTGRMLRGRIRQQLHHRERGDGFSRPRLADQRHRLALLDIERYVVDRERHPLALTEGDGKVFHLKQFFGGRVHFYPNVLRGSKASRTASPMKISSDSMPATVRKPEKPSQGAWILALPCLSNSPSEAEPGGRPKPRKSSAVSVITDDDRMNGRNVIVATIAFGSRWRNMITQFETPSARAAWIYSKLRPRRNSARTRPTSDTQENRSRIPSSTKKPGTSTDEMMSKR